MSKESLGNRSSYLCTGVLWMLCTIAAVFCLPKIALGQSETATISGTVADQSGAVIPQAVVQLVNVETGTSASIETTIDGLYVFYNVRPGLYRMTVTKNNFRKVTLSDLIVNVQDLLGRNFTMNVGAVSESVSLTADVVKINTQGSSVSTLVDQQFVGNMPLNGRSFQALIQLTPGTVVVPTDQSAPGQFSANGNRTNANYTTVDGVGTNFGITPSSSLGQTLGGTSVGTTIQGGTNALVSVEAMQEFRIQTSNFAPEFGRTPGAQLSIVTKSGTSQFHGTLYDYIRNEIFDARNYFNRVPDPKPPLRQNNFGGTVGGPIVKDKTFFFFSYEGLRLQQPQTATGTFYTPETRAAVASVYRPIIDSFPVPNGPLVDPTCDNLNKPCLATLNVSYSDPSSFDSLSLRIDQVVNRRLNVFGRLSYAPSEVGSRFWQDVEFDRAINQTLTLGATMGLSSTSVNELRVNWSRSAGRARTVLDDFHGGIVPPSSVLFRAGTSPNDSQSTFLLANGLGLQVGTRSNNAQRQLNVVDSLSFSKAAHMIKLGVDWRMLTPTNSSANGPVYAIVRPFSSLVNGTVSAADPFASDVVTVRTHNVSLFVQDTWKATSRLSLTYGMRWDLNTAPASADDDKPLYPMQGVFDSQPVGLGPAGAPIYHNQYAAFAPRIGAAYQLTSGTVVRGGFGLFYDLGYPLMLGQLTAAFPYTRSMVRPGAGTIYDPNSPLFAPPPFTTTLSAKSLSPIAIDPNLSVPMCFQWNVSVQHDIARVQSITLSYVGADGERLLQTGAVRPPGSPTAFWVALNGGYSHYNALQAQFQRKMTNGFQALVSYSVVHSTDTGSNDFYILDRPSAISVNDLALPLLSRSDFDIRHNLSAAISYELPQIPLGRIGDAVLGRWVLDGIERLSSAPPLDIRIGSSSSTFSSYRTIPDLVSGQPIWVNDPGEPSGRRLNADAFTLPSSGYYGTLGRNSVQSPYGIAQTDIALRRRFNISERWKLDFRAEFFNLFNHPMFGGHYGPDSFWGYCYSTPCTGKQSGTFGYVVPSAGTLNVGLGGGGLSGGQSPLYAIGGPRSTQFTLKLLF